MAITGKPDARARFTELFRAHYGQVAAFARRRVGPGGAQEVAAETMLVAWRRLDDAPAAPLPWLYRIASYEVSNFRRRQARAELSEQAARRDRLLRPASPGESDSAPPSAVELAFGRLADSDQEILRLSAWEELNSREGAEALGCSQAAYRVRLHRARRRLAEHAGITKEQSACCGQGPQQEAEPVQPARQSDLDDSLHQRFTSASRKSLSNEGVQ
ncbi:MAG: RNA polymerase sigma factor [Acidimicrobiales bacterium]